MEPVFPLSLTLPDPQGGTLTHALHRQLRAAILDGRLPSGFVMPSTRRTSEGLKLARNTVIAAYDLLMAEGYIQPRRGAPPVVAEVLTRPGRGRAPAAVDRRELFSSEWSRWPPVEPAHGDMPWPSFRVGIPDHRHFPHAEWRRLTARAQRQQARQPFCYGPATGLPALRDAIAGHVAFTRAVACTAENVLVTNGAQQAFDLLARLLTTPGRTRVAVEDPGYQPLRAAFLAAGATLQGVPVDDEGLRVDALDPNTNVVIVTPSHQSPTGVVLSAQRRQALLDFAQRRGAVIIEDDYDGEFRFGGRPLDALQTLDRDGRVFYVGTFSKSLFPALRKGFVVAPPWASEALTTLKHYADSHCDTLTQSVLAAFIEEGHLARHVRRMHSVYGARREALLRGLSTHLAEWLEPIPSEAGLHLAARLRDPGQARRIHAAARRHAPGAQGVGEYALSDNIPPALTFGYGAIESEAIEPALRSLARALRG